MTREQWLNAAVRKLRPLFRRAGVELPKDIAVSCGFPGGGSPRKRIGECWSSKVGGGVSQVFVSPTQDKPLVILTVLTHELVHALDDCASGHGGAFARVAKAVGLEGKMTQSNAGKALTAELKEIASKLGPYPHKAIKLGENVKTQSTRMLKLQAACCGYTVRTTAKWIDEGFPSCPCGTEMERA